MAGTPALTCPNCRCLLEYHVTVEMLDPPIGKIDTGYCGICMRLFECVRQTNTYYQSTLWQPLCRQCRQPVTFAGVAANGDEVRYACRDHTSEQWTWTRNEDRWMRGGS
jgi:hypothetical protein